MAETLSRWNQKDILCVTVRLDPEVASNVMRQAGLEPLAPYPGSDVNWPCRCMRCGEDVFPRYGNIKSGWGGCRKCRYEAQSVRQRNPASDAVDRMRTAGLEPLEPYPGRQHPWRSRCLKCDEIVTPRLDSILSGHGGCIWCARRAVDAVNAAQVMINAGLEPLVSYPGAHGRWLCRCPKCDSEVTPMYGNVLQGHGGCRPCSTGGGFKPSKAAVVYLVFHDSLHAVKVGVGNIDADRLERHRKRGWTVVTTVPVTGEMALEIEKDILRWWRVELALPAYLSATEMPHRGWTETVDADAIDIPATVRRIEELASAVAIPAAA